MIAKLASLQPWYIHRVVFSLIGDPPPKIGVYLRLLTVILGFLKSVRGLCKIGAAAFAIVVCKLLISSAPDLGCQWPPLMLILNVFEPFIFRSDCKKDRKNKGKKTFEISINGGHWQPKSGALGLAVYILLEQRFCQLFGR